jgi:hypothetical protein
MSTNHLIIGQGGRGGKIALQIPRYEKLRTAGKAAMKLAASPG